MNRAKRRMTVRERRERKRRISLIAHILISVVALIECFVLVSFTTYSWIESSSSLIISSGSMGHLNMAVAKNTSYMVRVSLDSAGKVDLNSTSSQGDNIKDNGGFYRTVQNFSLAKTFTPDGKTFYFERPADLGLSGADKYRKGDTADFNTSYTYFDFVLRNTTGSNMAFYFDAGGSNHFFRIANASSLSDLGATVYESYTAQQVILNALRVSFTVNDGVPLVLSLNGNNAVSPLNGAGAVSNTTVASYTILSREYDNESLSAAAVFESLGNEENTKVGVRVWFDQFDSVYNSITGDNKALVDSLLYAAQIEMDFSLISDNLNYDRIYFDDYAFSDTYAGRYVTRENSVYSMYLHVYNGKVGDFVNYPMSITPSANSNAVRWATSVPISLVVKDYLTTTTPSSVTIGGESHDPFAEAYFFYGSVTEGEPTPNKIAYQWSLPGAFSLTDQMPTDEPDGEYDTIDNNVVRNLGVVRSADDQDTVSGYLQFDDGSDPMTLVSFRDQATALTGQLYNQDGAGNFAYQFITHARSQTALESNAVLTKIYYADIPQDTRKIIISNGDGGGMNQTVDIYAFNDGQCFKLSGTTDGTSQIAMTDSIALPTASSLGMDDVKRIYFYNAQYNGSPDWNDPKIYYIPGSKQYPGTGMTHIDAPSTQRKVDHVYINQISSVAENAAVANQAAAAMQTVQMRYDTGTQLWSAYVPSSWLTVSGSYIHFNGKADYYNDALENVRWNIGVASAAEGSGYVYTALGYTNNQKIDSLTGGSGVGTWGAVRAISFNTELIDSNVNSAYVYKVGVGNGQYAMAPTDAWNMNFTAYVPVDGLATQSSQRNLRFTRYAAYNSNAVTGTWYPHENITAAEQIYYAFDATAADSNAATQQRGWFHVAVFVDGTFENLVYQTALGSEAATSRGYLSYSFDGSTYTKIAEAYSSTDTGRPSGDTTRWVIPMGSNTYIYFYWAPYPATSTVFYYEYDITNGIYFVVTEAATPAE